jgi:uncharacterized protein YuzE
MKITYDPEVDILRIVFSEGTIEESDEEKPGLILKTWTASASDKNHPV